MNATNEQKFTETFAAKLKALRLKKELTLDRVSKGAGVSQRAYCTWEAAQKLPTGASIYRLASFYGITPSDLLR